MTTPKTESAVFKVTIAGTIEAVWKELTRTDDLQPAMFNTQLHTRGLAPGAKIAMRTKNGKYTGVVGEVLEFDPPRRYAHTFRFTQYDDPPCTVIYELSEVPGGVEFILRVEDMPVGTKTTKEMTRGGTMIVNTMKAVIETGKPTLGTRLLFVLFKLMEPFSPAKTRSGNWPV